jgi:hypothetical protein
MLPSIIGFGAHAALKVHEPLTLSTSVGDTLQTTYQNHYTTSCANFRLRTTDLLHRCGVLGDVNRIHGFMVHTRASLLNS